MKIKFLVGAQLDYAVAKCSGPTMVEFFQRNEYTPSTDWEQGGPIIEREKISIDFDIEEAPVMAMTPNGKLHSLGPTPLIAAMRCYVASKLGEEVEIPEGLK